MGETVYVAARAAETERRGGARIAGIVGHADLDLGPAVEQVLAAHLEHAGGRFRGYRQEVRAFLPRYRAYVHASYSESSSLAIIEAMAAGLPIVAANIGPIGSSATTERGADLILDDPALATKTLTDLLDCEPERLMAASAARAVPA